MTANQKLEPWKPGHRVIWVSPTVTGMIDSGMNVDLQDLDELMPDCEQNERKSHTRSDAMMFKSAIVANRAIRKMTEGNK